MQWLLSEHNDGAQLAGREGSSRDFRLCIKGSVSLLTGRIVYKCRGKGFFSLVSLPRGGSLSLCVHWRGLMVELD